MGTTQTLTGGRTNPVQVGASVTTGLFAVLIAISGVLYLVGPPPIVAAIRNLGYPDYVRPLLGIAKLLGAGALILPRSRTLRERSEERRVGKECRSRWSPYH